MLGGILQDVSDFEGIAGNREHTVLVESGRDPLPKLLHFDANICYSNYQHAVSLSVRSATSKCIVLLTLPCQSPKFLCRFLDLISVARGRNSV
jgi:hypothetical protein